MINCHENIVLELENIRTREIYVKKNNATIKELTTYNELIGLENAKSIRSILVQQFAEGKVDEEAAKLWLNRLGNDKVVYDFSGKIVQRSYEGIYYRIPLLFDNREKFELQIPDARVVNTSNISLCKFAILKYVGDYELSTIVSSYLFKDIKDYFDNILI